MPPTEHQQNNFDFIRVVAAFCVIVSHQFALAGLREPSVLDVHSIGGFGVLVFFSISGYLVSKSWEADPNAFRFLLKRFLRIWPGLAVVVLLAALVLGPLVSKLSLHDYYFHPLMAVLKWRPEQRFALEFSLFFFAGVLFHQLDVQASVKRQRWALALCLCAALIANALHRPLLSLWLAVPMTTLIFGTASTACIRHTGRYGDVSYGLYLYAFPVQQTLFWLYKDKLSWPVLLGLVSAITWCLAFASWHLVEKMALRLKPGRSTPIDVTPMVAVCLMIFVVLR
jgi:peptidoglycan/LPS O-acetylase OafA/YrhL